MTTERVAAAQRKPPLYRNGTFLKWAAQIGIFFGVLALFWILGSQAASNLQAQGRAFTWDFLTDPPGIQLSEGIFLRPDTGLEAFATGIVNMFRITFSGIIAATVIGVVVGVSRLSSNWLLSKLATVFVESIRNVPLLVLIVFFFFVCALFFPEIANEESGPVLLIFSRAGISIPWFFPTATFWQWMAFVAVGVLAARYVYKLRDKIREQTGRDAHAFRFAILTFIGVTVVGWFAHPIAGAIGWIWQLLGAIVDAIPLLGWQLLFAAASVFVAVRWIRGFLDSMRTPAGLAKLSDDDYFRMALAGLVGAIGAALFLFVPGVATVITDASSFVLDFFDQKFDFLRTGSPLRFDMPEVVKPGNFAAIGPQGMTLTPAFFGVWVGVTLFTAAYIGEIVRGGVLAVPKGQTEAAMAVGLRRSQMLRMIILPQAFRIILPPIGNQYLNLAKNTSLGIAVAYPEIVAVGSTIQNQTGQALQVVVLWMAFYLTVSLSLSAVVNYYNRKLKLVER